MIGWPAALVLAALTPPPLPPPADSFAAAIDMIAHNPPAADMVDRAFGKALETIANGTVSSGYAGEWGGARWREYHRRFTAQITAMVAPHRSGILAAAYPCLAQGYAFAMSPADLAATDAFLVTPAGRSFWRLTGPSEDMLASCLYTPARERIDFDAALVASGLPRQGQPRLNR